MKSLLDALQEGRLIELPETDKVKDINLLATLIEAIPDFRGGFDFVGAVGTREAAANTGIGLGWACPRGRVSGDGDLFCAIGWSPTGIDYGAPDGKPVRILVMHYIPDSQKNVYLKEISGLAKAIKSNPALGELSSLKDLGEVRHRLIDLLTAAVDSALPDVKARMIQLEAKQAVSALGETLPADVLSALSLIPLSVIIVPGSRPLVLAQDKELIAQIEAGTDVAVQLGARAPFDHSGYRIFTRSVSSFQSDRLLYDCIAVKVPGSGKEARMKLHDTLTRVHDSWQRLGERVFFRGQSTRFSEALAFIAANLFLYVVVFYVLLNTVVYDWTGSLYSSGFHLVTALDTAIPFVPEWAVFYLYLFYPLSALTMAWFALADHRRGYPLAISLILINVVADLVYLVFPVTTDLWRAELLAHPILGNAFATAMYTHYTRDPSFNCFPSLHAGVATITFYAWHRYARLLKSRAVRGISIGMLVVGIGVVLSTLFVKQHYVADEIAGILLAWGVGRWVFDDSGDLPGLLDKASATTARPK